MFTETNQTSYMNNAYSQIVSLILRDGEYSSLNKWHVLQKK
jgi:hypothetical protein